MQNERPDPDQLLAQVKAQEAAAQRGHLRIYFGASAGVGKTYAMLAAARALRNEGKDIISEGPEILKKAAQFCTPLKQALDTWGDITFNYTSTDTSDYAVTPTASN